MSDSTARPFLWRLALAGGGMALLCATGYIGLGCAVRWMESDLSGLLGSEHYDRLFLAYEKVAAGLRTVDRDGDGASDGREFFNGTDPLDPQVHPVVRARIDRNGLIVDYWGFFANDIEIQNVRLKRGFTEARSGRGDPYMWVCAPPGERCRVAARLESNLGPTRAPHGFRVLLTSEDDVLLAPPGGTLAPGPLKLAVDSDGSFSLDVQLMATAKTGPGESRLYRTIAIDNPTTTEALGVFSLLGVWRLPPIIPKVETVAPKDVRDLRRYGFTDARSEPDYRALSWPAAPPEAEALLIEVARDRPGAEWSTFHFTEASTQTSCVVRRVVGGPWDPYSGPMKFRVVPVRCTPPPPSQP